MISNPEALLTTKEVAEYLGVRYALALEISAQPDYPRIRLGKKCYRTRLRDLRAWLETRKQTKEVA